MSKYQVGDVLYKPGYKGGVTPTVTVKSIDTHKGVITYWVQSHLDNRYFTWKESTLDNCGWVKKPEWEEVSDNSIMGYISTDGPFNTLSLTRMGVDIINHPNYKINIKVERRVK